MTPDLDLTVEGLARVCRGDVKSLPSFMVHDNDVWSKSVVRTDSKGRVHMRRATFNQVVVGQIPIRAGLWHGKDVQEFFIALMPHHLQGTEETEGGAKLWTARHVAQMDNRGRLQGDEDYGESDAGSIRATDVAADVRQAKAMGTSRSVRSSLFD